MHSQKPHLILPTVMAKVKKGKKPPEGYDRIEPTLTKLRSKLKEAQKQSIKAETKTSSLWPILKLNNQISRYVYSMYYDKKIISKELYDYLLQQKEVNAELIAKWKKQGYEHLCCVNCIVVNEKHHGTTCICRVPTADVKRINDGCVACGCLGCASTDKA